MEAAEQGRSGSVAATVFIFGAATSGLAEALADMGVATGARMGAITLTAGECAAADDGSLAMAGSTLAALGPAPGRCRFSSLALVLF